jgi:16S rRNA (cytidine1402-2'-O)-methyltransferase
LTALTEGDVALISEAGMPGLSDPGYDLIREAIRRDIPVVPVPGPTALVSALVVSGLPTDSFVYLGFLPRRSGERRHVLQAVQQEGRTLVFYEAPHRLLDTLRDLLDVLGDRTVAVARELTKMYEEVFRGPVSAAIVRFEAVAPRGEFTVVVHGLSRDEKPVEFDETQVLTMTRQLVAGGLSAKSAAAEVAERTGWSRRRVYELLHR